MKYLSNILNDQDITTVEWVKNYVDDEGGKIDTISVDNIIQPIDENKNVNIDLSGKADKTDLDYKVDKDIEGATGKARIFNEADGGGAKFEHTDGTNSFIGVNDGGKTGIDAQIYALDSENNGARIDITTDGIYYTVGNDSAAERLIDSNKLIVKNDVENLVDSFDLIKLAEAETGYIASYKLMIGENQVGSTINIPKDFLVKDAKLKIVEIADEPYTGAKVGDKYIDFMINVKIGATAETEHIYLPVNDLVDVYTGDDTSIVIDEHNIISIKSDYTAGIESTIETAINTEKTRAEGAEADLLAKFDDYSTTTEMETAIAKTGWEAGIGEYSVQTIQKEINKNNASGESSVSEGAGTDAHAFASHTEGYMTSTGASANYSHAEGYKTSTQGIASHAEGDNTVTNNPAEHAEGRYNKSNMGGADATNTLSSIGIGSASGSIPGGDRKNAVEVMQNGDTYIIGVGNYDGTNPEEAISVQDTISSLNENLVNEISNREAADTELQNSINSILPAQEGQAGKFLTTNGTNVSWATIPEGIPTLKLSLSQIISFDDPIIATVTDEQIAIAQNYEFINLDATELDPAFNSGLIKYREDPDNIVLCSATYTFPGESASEIIAIDINIDPTTKTAEVHMNFNNLMTYVYGDEGQILKYEDGKWIADYIPDGIPKLMLSTSAMISDDPVTIRLTDEECNILANNKFIDFNFDDYSNAGIACHFGIVKYKEDEFATVGTSYINTVYFNSTAKTVELDQVNIEPDYMYNPESPYAQSGFAVKQAIDTKQDKLTADNKLSTDYISGLSTVATSGDYADLTNKPTIPDISTKMDKENPTGTGSLSINRLADSDVGENSVAVGEICIASGNDSMAEGFGTEAIGDCSHAEGNHTVASGHSSHAEGNQTEASGDYSHAEGGGGGSVPFTTADGECSHAEGVGTTSSGMGSHTEGTLTYASAPNAHAEGIGSQATGYESHAEGYYTQAPGDCSHAEGNETVAVGRGSHAEGGGDGSVSSTIAEGDYAHAENFGTIASGYASHAEGSITYTSGYASHAEGSSCSAIGAGSHAEGYCTKAKAGESHAEGDNTIASSDMQHVQGKYNVEDTENIYADIVGGGTYNARKNIEATTWTGDKRLKGDVYVNCNDDSTGGTKLAKITDIPTTYIKNASVSENILTLTKQDDTTITFAGGSGSGAVDSVNGKTGEVVLTGEDISLSSTVSNSLDEVLTAMSDELGNKQDAITSSNKLPATNVSGLATVATSGSYADLSGKPALANVATSGSYNDLANKPTIPTVNNATLTIQKNGTAIGTFTANASANVTANITVPTKTSELTNDSSFLTSVFQAGATAPSNTKLLWIDTSAGGLKYYNGSSWVAVPTFWM